jgi:uncharacterized protein (DUF3084 family)
MGPTAQDVHAAFGLGDSDKAITTIDADGIALAAIQGLHRQLKDKDEAIKAQGDKIQELESRLSEIERRFAKLAEK